jgi:transglutaminase-like putative cysteine protease
MFYSIRHITRFRYSAPVSESMMEVRMHPRSEEQQRCITFQLSVNPRTRVFSYRDYSGNFVHHFDIPRQHQQLVILAESVVDVQEPLPLPPSLPHEAWQQLAESAGRYDFGEYLRESDFINESPQLLQLRDELQAYRRADPLTLVQELNQGVFESFYYDTEATKVDSPIAQALESRKGVCQDFAQIMIALLRPLGIPARYVSGYLFHSKDDTSADGASHAWVEVYLPRLGWVGFDPTNNILAGQRHIRVALGRDYADVPPTRGNFRGSALSDVQFSVRVSRSDRFLPAEEELTNAEEWTTFLARDREAEAAYLKEQQQQQQQ